MTVNTVLFSNQRMAVVWFFFCKNLIMHLRHPGCLVMLKARVKQEKMTVSAVQKLLPPGRRLNSMLKVSALTTSFNKSDAVDAVVSPRSPLKPPSPPADLKVIDEMATEIDTLKARVAELQPLQARVVELQQQLRDKQAATVAPDTNA